MIKKLHNRAYADSATTQSWHSVFRKLFFVYLVIVDEICQLEVELRGDLYVLAVAGCYPYLFFQHRLHHRGVVGEKRVVVGPVGLFYYLGADTLRCLHKIHSPSVEGCGGVLSAQGVDILRVAGIAGLDAELRVELPDDAETRVEGEVGVDDVVASRAIVPDDVASGSIGLVIIGATSEENASKRRPACAVMEEESFSCMPAHRAFDQARRCSRWWSFTTCHSAVFTSTTFD